MHLNHVHTRFLRTHRTGAHFVDDLHQGGFGHLIDEMLHVVVQLRAHVVHFAIVKQRVEGINVIFGVKNLHTELCAVGMHVVCE